MRRVTTLLCATFLLAFAPRAHAQEVTLKDAVDQLFTFGSCGVPVCLDPSLPGDHGFHFNPDAIASQELLVAFLQSSIPRAISSLPLASASGGALFRPGPTGAPVRTNLSDGPIFAERANTLGAGRVLFGANISGLSFSSLRGEDLGSLLLRLTHDDTPPEDGGAPGNPSFERDVIEITADMDVQSVVGLFYGTVGVTNQLDVSVALPIVRTEVSGTSVAQIVVAQGNTPIHFFDQSAGTTSAQSQADQSASGIGDIALRAKYSVNPRAETAFGVIADVRLPTGDEDDFLGTGNTVARGLVVVSRQYGVLGPHINAGYVFRGGDFANDGFLATVGADALVADWLTLAADVISEFETGDQFSLPGAQTYVDGSTVDRTDLPDVRDHLMDLAVGAKIRPTGALKVVTNLLVPINKGRGLRPDLIWTAGLEYNFGR